MKANGNSNCQLPAVESACITAIIASLRRAAIACRMAISIACVTPVTISSDTMMKQRRQARTRGAGRESGTVSKVIVSLLPGATEMLCAIGAGDELAVV